MFNSKIQKYNFLFKNYQNTAYSLPPDLTPNAEDKTNWSFQRTTISRKTHTLPKVFLLQRNISPQARISLYSKNQKNKCHQMEFFIKRDGGQKSPSSPWEGSEIKQEDTKITSQLWVVEQYHKQQFPSGSP